MQQRSSLGFFDNAINSPATIKNQTILNQIINKANEVLNLTLSLVVSSSNTLSDDAKSTVDGQAVLESMNKMRSEEITDPCYTRAWIASVAEQAKRWRVGNCCEKSCIAFQLLLESIQQGELPSDTSIEMFNNPFVDHFFIVVGRDILTDASNPETWNKDTIVCDPWAQRECYFLNSVGFRTQSYSEFEAIRHLSFSTNLIESLPEQPFILKEDVLAKSNGIKDKRCVILSQDRFVLRSRYNQQGFRSFNEHVPMCYEEWDYPTKKNYEKQTRLEKKRAKDGFSNVITP